MIYQVEQIRKRQYQVFIYEKGKKLSSVGNIFGWLKNAVKYAKYLQSIQKDLNKIIKN